MNREISHATESLPVSAGRLGLPSYRFGPFLLDLGRIELRKDDLVIPLEPKTFDLIRYLVQHRDRVVPKEELLAKLWPAEVVSEGSLTHCVVKARKALEDAAEQQAMIRTVRKRGYRFVLPVEQIVEDERKRNDFALEHGSVREAPAMPALIQRSTMIGRNDQLLRLTGAWKRARAGRGGLVLVTGEPGIGKTALVRLALQQVEEDAGRILIARCHETEGAPPYWPWLQLLRSYLTSTPVEEVRDDIGVGATDLARVLPELRRIWPDLTTASDLDAAESRFRLFDSVASFFRRAAQRRQMALFLDDVQWADEASILLLSFVARELEGAPLVIFATCRDAERTTGQFASENPWRRLLSDPALERLPLDGLSEAEVASLVLMSQGRPASPEHVRALHRVSSGNPFFVHELIESVALDLSPKASATISAAEPTVPKKVREALLRRLAKLSPACRDVLMAASVIGPVFGATTLSRLVHTPMEELLELLDEACAARWLQAIAGEFQFAHDLVRDSLRAELPVARRAELHQGIGEMLEERRREEGSVSFAEIAYHFCEAAVAGNGAQALDYAVRAADEAEAAMSYEEAAERYGLALRMAEHNGGLDRRGRSDILMRHGISLSHSGRTALAREKLLQAANIAEDIGATDLLARAALHYSGTGPYRRFMRAQGVTDRQHVALLERALVGLPLEPSSIRARVSAELAAALHGTEHESRSDALMERALSDAESCGEQTTLAAVLSAKQATLLAPDRLGERLALTEQLVPLAREIGAVAVEVEARWTRAVALAELGDLRAADAEIAAVAELKEAMRLPALRWLVSAWWLARTAQRGHLRDAELQFALMEQEFAGQFARSDEALAGQRCYLRVVTGRGEEVLAELEEFVRRFPRTFAWRARLAATYAMCQHTDDARAEFELLARSDFADVPHDDTRMGCLYYLSLACGLLLDAKRAEKLYALLSPYAQRMVYVAGFSALGGSVAQLLGILALVTQDWASAEQHFEQSLARNERIGALLPMCVTELIYGHMLAGRGDPRGKRMLARAVERATEMGMSYPALPGFDNG